MLFMRKCIRFSNEVRHATVALELEIAAENMFCRMYRYIGHAPLSMDEKYNKTKKN